jgi:hypothetical protein
MKKYEKDYGFFDYDKDIYKKDLNARIKRWRALIWTDFHLKPRYNLASPYEAPDKAWTSAFVAAAKRAFVPFNTADE